MQVDLSKVFGKCRNAEGKGNEKEKKKMKLVLVLYKKNLESIIQEKTQMHQLQQHLDLILLC